MRPLVWLADQLVHGGELLEQTILQLLDPAIERFALGIHRLDGVLQSIQALLEHRRSGCKA